MTANYEQCPQSPAGGSGQSTGVPARARHAHPRAPSSLNDPREAWERSHQPGCSGFIMQSTPPCFIRLEKVDEALR